MPETPLSWDDLDGNSVVKMVCDSAKCTRPHHLTHAACFNKLEAFGVAQLKGKVRVLDTQEFILFNSQVNRKKSHRKL